MTATGYVSATGDTRKVNRAGDTMTGELVLPDSSPDTTLAATSKGYVDGKFATQLDLTALSGTVNSLSTAVTNLDVFVGDCLTRVAAIEAGTAYLAGAHFTAPVDISEGGLSLTSSGTAIISINRGTTANFAGVALKTGGAECWPTQLINDGTNDFRITDTANGVDALRITPHATTPTVAIAGVAAAGSKKIGRASCRERV